jgi:hypothetical protein
MENIICIVVLENNINKIHTIQNTWIKFCSDIKYYFIIDDTFNFGNDKNYIYLNNLQNDTHFTIFRHFSNIDYNFMLVTYINSFVNVPNLIKLINTLDPNDDYYIGGHGDYRTINNIKFYFHSYTPGIIVSKFTTNSLLDKNLMNDYNKICTNKDLQNLSGVAIAYYVNIFNIKLIINDNFYFCNWQGHPCHTYEVNSDNLICCSNMEINDMLNYYKILIDNDNNIDDNLLDNNIDNNLLDNNNDKMHIIICPGGGLGNILFQYFNSYVLSKKYNCKISYQCNYDYWRGCINKYKMFKDLDFVDLTKIDTTSYYDYNELHFYHYDIKLLKKNYKISGYYQSYKYSQEYIQDIKNELFYNIASTYYLMENKYYKIKNNKETCLIHVRRGDYLMFSNVHPPCTDNYYREAIKLIPNCKYLVCSDDINYVTNWNVLKNIDHEIININDSEELLVFMTLCDNFIIANSTLSLIAYLLRNNKNAKVVGPKNWFGPAGYKYKIEDIVPPEVILI